ncbi:AMP-binding protein [Actinorugispora endophytica]|uniref:Acetyl-CoA synthetase n=1 Tax=Actinorugispora endophytica TaxID=1605990 RepID=A0A4R6UXP7_9ACTN|nr:AMP-binding protein [Actinorugispora endophytica]TDQ50703.1 acetyl-CoA synthetase [Actinorugispora endophytica]
MADPQQQVRDWLTAYGSPTACAAHLLCDRHDADATAVTEVHADLSARTLTYGELARRSTTLAVALRDHGVTAGDHVATLIGPGVDLTVTAVALWRLGAVLVPLSTTLAASAIDQRLRAAAARAVVCPTEHHPKITRDGAPWTVITPDQTPHDDTPVDTAATGGDAPFVLLYTAGVSGPPRGVPVPLRALTALHAHHRYGLGVRADDVYWCAGEPDDPNGLYYGLISPLLAGHSALHLRAGFDPELTLDVLETFGVTYLATSPTAYRALRSTTKTLPPGIVVRRLASAGQALRSDTVEWALGTFGVGIGDHYGQPETGIIATNDSLGGPLEALPGIDLHVLEPVADTPVAAGEFGRVAVDTASSPALWFTGYHADPTASARRFSPDGRWYLTGDTGIHDPTGRIRLSRRDDEVIITSGYRVGPYDVESVLLEHPLVEEAAVYGVPDPARGARVAANVVLAQGAQPTPELADALTTLVAQRFAEHAAPHTLNFVPQLPRTASGKLRRNRLRAGAAQ